MDYKILDDLNITDLKQYAAYMDLDSKKSKKELITDISNALKTFEKYKTNQELKYEKLKKLGESGKDGTTYLVKNNKNEYYAMKTFKKNKSSESIETEAYLQSLANKQDVAPRVKEVDTVLNFIVMEKLDYHLIDIMKKQDGNLSKSQQLNIIDIYKKLDIAKVFHGDANILNYMCTGNKIYIIDFGMSKKITSKLIKELGTSTPNISIMLLGFVLKLKELKCPETSYKYLITHLSKNDLEKFKI
jgi:tRNA A-37 threonylcarbamoyl transferase component Bud32